MKKYYYVVSFLVVLSLVLTGMANAASTIGTNMSTTGTFTQTVDSAIAARFQNAAADLNVLVVDTTNRRVGIGAVPGTTFEVQGTASASYFFTQNTIQVAGTTGSVAWSRFGTGTAGHTDDINASNDVLITGALEVDGNAFFDGKASVSGNFQTAGRFIAGNASHSFTGSLGISKNLIVGSVTASGSGAYAAEFIGAGVGTASFYFGGGDSATKGTCFQLKSTSGAWIYMRFNQDATTPTLSTIKCR